jgi:long-subunit fatty acid transport protein
MITGASASVSTATSGWRKITTTTGPGATSRKNASVLGVSMVPSVAYRFNDQWSVSIGVKAMYGMLKADTAIDRSPFGLTDRSDGQFKYRDNDWGFGANVGVICPATRHPSGPDLHQQG